MRQRSDNRRGWRVCWPPRVGFTILLTAVLVGQGGAQELDLGPLDDALVLLKLSRRDLRVKPNFEEDRVGGGKLRLGVVTNGLRSAVGSACTARDLGYRLTGETDPDPAFETLSGLLDVGPIRIEPPAGALHAQAPLALALAEPDKRDTVDPGGAAPEPVPRLPMELRQALAALVYGVARANRLLARTTRELSAEDLAIIRDELPSVLLQKTPPGTATVLRSLTVASRIDLRDVLSAAAALMGAVAEARTCLATLGATDGWMEGATAAETVVSSHTTDFGEVVVAGTGGNTHDRPAAILVDLGGNDRYLMARPAEQPAPPICITIDLGGDDTYEPTGSFGPSAAMLGVSVLVDERGDDLYVAKAPFSFGAAICGTGVLIDGEGEDRYLGDVFGQGAAMFGLGMLVEGGGDDIYDAQLYAQGFGCVKGVGALIDHGGNDRYRVGHTYLVAQQGQERMLACAQGFGFGLRDFASGGVGILADADGADVYVADMLSQGAAWWYAAGLLFDRAGDDQYQGSEYSQGAAAFLSVADLLDEGGNDRYGAVESAQGYACERSLAVLRDAAGDDTYVAERMAQGAAMANGIAIAADLGGRDIYTSRSDSLGHAPSVRGAATVGLFADGGGRDSYGNKGSNDLCWLSGGLGAGIDLDGDLSRIRAIIPMTAGRIIFPAPLPVGPAVLWPMVGEVEPAGLEDLWALATGATDPTERRRAERMLVGLREKAVPYLIGKLAIRDPALRATGQDLLVDIGPPAVPELLKLMEEGGPAEAEAAMAVLGRIGDPRAATPLAEKAKSPQWRTRAAAAAGMGALRGEDTRLVLEQLLRDEDEDVRRTALMALRYRGETESADAVSDLLGDSVLANRFAAADALIGLGVRVPPHVLSLVGSEQPEVKHLSLETCGRLGSKQSVDMLINLLASDNWGDRAFAAEALCRIGDGRACEKLEELLGRETNGLVLAKVRGAMKATGFCAPQQQVGK